MGWVFGQECEAALESTLAEVRVQVGAAGESAWGLSLPAPCCTVARTSSGTWSGSSLMRFTISMMLR